MSDNWLIFVPIDPYFQPTEEGISSAVALARTEFADAEEVEAQLHDKPSFVTPGANLESVACPKCNEEIFEWFMELMDDRYDDGFDSLTISTPCCEQALSANELNFDWQAAFRRFQLDVMNPNVSDASDGFVSMIEEKLSTPVALVRCHI